MNRERLCEYRELLAEIANMPDKEFLGETVKDGRLYTYYLGSDNYVYQYIDGIRNGWLCSFTSWDNALRRLTSTEANRDA